MKALIDPTLAYEGISTTTDRFDIIFARHSITTSQKRKIATFSIHFIDIIGEAEATVPAPPPKVQKDKPEEIIKESKVLSL